MFPINIVIMMSIGLLISSPLAGFALLRSYEDFCKGVDRNNSLRIWSAFFGSSFIFIILISSVMGLVVKSPERSILDCMLITCIGSPLIAAVAGFSLLQAYKSFQKGVVQNSRVYIWSAFLIGAATFILAIFVTMKLVMA